MMEGFLPDQITAVEVSPSYSRLGSGIFSRFGVNCITEDFLSWEPGLKFDTIIGNPPYQDSSTDCKSKKLWLAFLDKAVELLEEGGNISLLTPNSVIGTTREPARIRKLFTGDFSLVQLNHDYNDCFPRVSVGICGWFVRKVPYEGETKVTSRGEVRVMDVRKELPTPFHKKDNQDLAFKIYDSFKSSDLPFLDLASLRIDLPVDEEGTHTVYTSGRNKSYTTNSLPPTSGQWKFVVSGSATYKQWFVTQSAVTGTNKYILVNSPEEGCEIGETLMHPVLRFYLDTWKKTAGYTPAIKTKNCVPDTRGLTYEEVFDVFNLTEEDKKLIVSTVEQYRVIERVIQ